MQAYFLAALGFALVAVMFALQNAVPVQVTFLAWTFEGSLAVVLFVAFMMGALVSVLVSVPSLIKARITANGLKRQVAGLESGKRDDARMDAATTSALAPARDASEDGVSHTVRAASHSKAGHHPVSI